MRKYYLDNIRWCTVLLVVVYHVIFIFNAVAPELGAGPFRPVQYQDAIQYLLYPWFMVLLFVVAGAGSRYALEKQTPKEFLASRTRKLLVPSTLGLFVFHWMGGYVNMKMNGAFDIIPANVPRLALYPIMAVSGTGVLWFIQMLWIFSLLLLPVRKLEKGKFYAKTKNWGLPVLILLALPLWLSAQILNTPVVTVYRFGIYGLAFFLGYFVFAHEEVVERLSEKWLPLSAAALVLGLCYTVYYFGRNYAVEPVVNSVFSMVYAWIAVLAVFALGKKFGDRTSPLAAWLGKRSFGLYVFHYLPMSAAALWLCRGLPALPAYLLAGLAAFAGGWGLYEGISRIPVLRRCLLGISKKEKRRVL